MLHSVGCPQPSAMAFINDWNRPTYTRACVHGFIDGNDAIVYQTLPWTYKSWHAGGAANSTHIGIEMCEPDCIEYTLGSNFICYDNVTAKRVVDRTYKAAVELFAYLCKKFNLNPLQDGVIISHREGYFKGVASGHDDPEHLWRGLDTGYTMHTFRRDVHAAMSGSASAPESIKVDSSANEGTIWNFLKRKGLNDFAVAGIMGNLYAESGLKPTNLQNNYEKSLGYTDDTYTKAVDLGEYDKFVTDYAGYGLAQWTYYTRKQNLLKYAKSVGKSVGDLDTQLEFLWKELSSYAAVMNVLKGATSVLEASNVFLIKFENPADQSDAVQATRAGYGQSYYNKYASKPSTATPTQLYRVRKSWGDAASQKGAFSSLSNAKACSDSNKGYSVFDSDGKVVYAPKVPTAAAPLPFSNYTVKVDITYLNIRKGPGTNYASVGYTGKGIFTIVDESAGPGATRWGKLKSGQGWISLDYATKC